MKAKSLPFNLSFSLSLISALVLPHAEGAVTKLQPYTYSSANGDGGAPEDLHESEGIGGSYSFEASSRFGNSEANSATRPNGDIGSSATANSTRVNHKAIAASRSITEVTVTSSLLDDGTSFNANLNFAVDGFIFMSGGNSLNQNQYGSGNAGAEMAYSIRLGSDRPLRALEGGNGIPGSAGFAGGIGTSDIARYTGDIDLGFTRNNNAPDGRTFSNFTTLNGANLHVNSLTEGITIGGGGFLLSNEYLL